MRKQSKTIIALVGEGVVNFISLDALLTVECFGRDLWDFRHTYNALPLVVECAGVRYSKVSFNSMKNEAYYH